MLLKEKEVSKRAAEQVPVIQEILVIDHEMMDKLSAENEKLKVSWSKCLCLHCSVITHK